MFKFNKNFCGNKNAWRKQPKKSHVALVQTSVNHTFAKVQSMHMAWFCGTNATDITTGQQ
jgi:uncharacterized protein (DUF849 family)